ncbi:ABC transporter ATP-binding protein [Selenomonas sp.]|uniref:ABC transporter ATP-binding protein n=1 Tax=Selenomonas sp. TaxID=2053611 RepID=UPI002A74E764|nr:ABC transporter ATP-binding protein [Selenomonas sp.]MDY3298303.1 ABC transporter ATP-binding protein [Selenomonas sp.]
MRPSPIITVDHVSMTFNLMDERVDTLKEYVVRLVKGQLFYHKFRALDDISLTIARGDIFGLIGLNGAGKSTLLKILAGVLHPSSGCVRVRGTIAPLIEVGAGFDPELTARENVYLNGAILGHSHAYLAEHFDDIIDFAELRDFVDVPVKNFSSGMYARLGFAIATEVRPDILIVDEVLSVGDYRFQEKCEERIQTMIKRGTTVIIVSHDIGTIKKMCNRVAWLERGRLRDIGAAEAICQEYEKA